MNTSFRPRLLGQQHTDTATPTNNVVAIRGGKVHAPNPATEVPWPLCRTGGQAQRGTRWTTTDRPVDCQACGPDRGLAMAGQDRKAGVQR